MKLKFKITSDCYRAGGVSVSAGDVLEDCTGQEITDLQSAGRGHILPAELPLPPVAAEGESEPEEGDPENPAAPQQPVKNPAKPKK